MKILDWYILKRYLLTFFTFLMLFIPIGITVHLAEKIGKIIENNVPFIELVYYFYDFTIYFAHILFPLFLFISVIWFTSKLANNTEIIAILSSGISFTRFLRPYFIGATIVAVLSIVLGLYLAPKASQGFNDFNYKYIYVGEKVVDDVNVFRQVNDNDIIFVSNFDIKNEIGYNFILEHFENNKMTFKINATTIKHSVKDSKSVYQLHNYTKRHIGEKGDKLETLFVKDTVFNFKVDDLIPVIYAAETKTYGDLKEFIRKEEERGSANVGRFKLVLYKKWSLPVAVFILTIIAVAVSSMKRRGGMGVNLALGIFIAMIFVFFDKIFGVMAGQASFPPLLAAWFPNIVFGILSIYLLKKAKR